MLGHNEGGIQCRGRPGTRVPTERTGVPRWAKVAGIIVAVVILLAIVMMVAGGGGGHQSPDHGLGDPDTPAVATGGHVAGTSRWPRRSCRGGGLSGDLRDPTR